MNDRRSALRRILAVQETVRRQAEAVLVAAEQRKAALDADRLALDRWAGTDAVHGPLARLADAQGRRLGQRTDAATAEVTRRTQLKQAAEVRHKLVGEVYGRIARETEAAAERRDLERLIEDMAGRAEPSA